MAKIYLTAQYKDKNFVKEKGAKYDPEKKKWYIDENNEEQLMNLVDFRIFMDINRYISLRLPRIDANSEEANYLRKWKENLEECRINGKIVDLDAWYGRSLDN